MKKTLSHALLLVSLSMQAQTFDFSCDPFASMITEFIEDSDDKSLRAGDFDGQLLTRAQIRVTRPLIYDEDGEFVSGLRDGVVAFAHTYACSPRANWVYVKEWWDKPSQTYEARKKVVYHEIGHSLYKYMHPTNAAMMVIDQFAGNNSPDIMGYNRELVADNSVNWINAITRFFAGTNHDLYICPTPTPYSGKSGPILIDN